MNEAFWLYFFIQVVLGLSYAIMVILILQNAFHLTWLWLAFFELRLNMRHEKRVGPRRLLSSDITFPISVLVPAYNEQSTVVENIRSLLALHYPDFEVILVNDGSTDRMLETVIEVFGLRPVERAYQRVVPHQKIRGIYGSSEYPNLTVVDKENGGKADALNAGINLSRCPLICSIDADSILDSDGLLRAVRPFIQEPERMVAVGGTIRIANGCSVVAGQVVTIGLPRQLIPLFQTIEYLRAYMMPRLAWTRMQTVLIISGAFGLFKRDTIIKVGGYSHGTVGEDMELVVKLHRYLLENRVEYMMCHVPDPVCWTEAPSTLRVLRRQRTRWQRGTLETLFKHRRMIFSPRHGSVGLLGMPYFFVFDVIYPVMELLGYFLLPVCWMIGILSLKFFIAYLMLAFLFGVFLSVSSLILAEITVWHTARVFDLFMLTVTAIVENFGYRQLNSLWRFDGMLQFFRGKRGWGTMPRSGFQKGGF